MRKLIAGAVLLALSVAPAFAMPQRDRDDGIMTTIESSPGALSRTAGMSTCAGRSGLSRLTFAPAAWCWWTAPRGLWLRTTSTIAATGAGTGTTSTFTTTTPTPAGICSTTPGWGVMPT